MRKILALLILMLLITTAHASDIKFNPDYEDPFVIGRDLPSGTYTMTIFAMEGTTSTDGIASYFIMRQTEGSYTFDIIDSDDFLTLSNPSCTLSLLDKDYLYITCSAGYEVRLSQQSGGTIEDKYPGAIEGVNLTQAINMALMYFDRYGEAFPGLKSIEIEYDDTLPSINLTLYYETGGKSAYAKHVRDILWILNMGCTSQNPTIRESTATTYGGIYDDLTVIIGVFDDTILYGGSFDTYYILPGRNSISQFSY